MTINIWSENLQGLRALLTHREEARKHKAHEETFSPIKLHARKSETALKASPLLRRSVGPNTTPRLVSPILLTEAFSNTLKRDRSELKDTHERFGAEEKGKIIEAADQA